MGRTGTRRLAGLLLGVALLAGACDSQDRSGPTPTREPATSAPAGSVPTPARLDKPCLADARLDKPCLADARSAALFRFRTTGGAVLVGAVLGRGRTGLVLAFDFSGFGDSRPGTGPDARIDTDVVAAAAQLRRRGADRIVLIGSSMGATAALSAATRIDPPVAGVVSLSGPGAFGAIDAWAAMPRLRVPVLFVAATGDHPFVDAARAMHRRARAADNRLLIVRRGHGSTLLTYREDGPRVLTAVRDFIADQAGS